MKAWQNAIPLTWVCGKQGLTGVIESHGRPRFVLGGRKPIGCF
jgi:hypothetical protein